MFDAVLVLIFVCCPSLSTSPVPVLSLSSTNFVSILTLSPCTTSDQQWSEKLYRQPNSVFVFLFCFFIYKIQTPVTRGCAGGGAACTQPTCSLGVVAQAVTKRNRGFTDEGRVETKETKERRRTEEVGGLEICGSAESVKSGLS